MAGLCGGGGGSTTTVQTGPAAEAQANLLTALAPYITGGFRNLAYGTLPTANRIADLSTLSPEERNLPAYLRANYDPMIGALGQGAGELFAGARSGLDLSGLNAASRLARSRAEGLDPTAGFRSLSPSLMAAPGEAFAPLNTEAILAPLRRSFTQTVAPEIRSSAMRSGVPGGGGEQDLFTRAAGQFGTQAGEALSNAELARRTVGLSGLNTALSGVMGAGQLALGHGGQALTGADIGLRSELQRRGLATPAILGAGSLVGQAAEAGAIAPRTAAEMASRGRGLDISAAGMPWQMALAALGGQVPNLFGAPTGSTTRTTPSLGAEIGGGFLSAASLFSIMRNLGLFL